MNDFVSYPLSPYLAAAKAKVIFLLHLLDNSDDLHDLGGTSFSYQGLFHYSGTSSQVEQIMPYSLALCPKPAIENYRFFGRGFSFNP